MMHTAIDRAWELLAAVAIRSCFLTLLAGACLIPLRKAASALRYLILLLLVTVLFALPLLSSTLPQWRLNWRIHAERQRTVPAATPNTWVEPAETDVPTAPTVRSQPILLSTPGKHIVTPHLSAVGTTPILRAQTRIIINHSIRYPIAKRPGSLPIRRVHAMEWQTIKQGFLALWLIGCIVALMRMLAGLMGSNRLWQSGRSVDGATARLALEAQQEVGIRREVVVLQAADGAAAQAPITWGWLRPSILLPAYLLDWPQERLRAILLHEMAHIRRCDWPVQILAQITGALYWFHPLVWWATHRLHEEGERACDDWVLLAGVPPSTYAATLLEVIRTMNTSGSFRTSALSVVRPPIEKRLRAILTSQPRQRTLRPVWLLACAGAVACALPLASVHVAAEPPGQSRGTRDLRSSTSSVEAGAELPGKSSPLRYLALSRDVLPVHSVPLNSLEIATIIQPAKHGEQGQATSRQSSQTSDQEVRLLRQKLDALEQLLVQNQAENRRLRLQLQRLQAEQRGANRTPMRVIPIVRAQSLQAQQAEVQAILLEQQAKQARLQADLNRAVQLQRQGYTSTAEVTMKEAEAKANEAAIQQTEQELNALKAQQRAMQQTGRLTTQQQQERIRLQQANVKAQQVTLEATLRDLQTKRELLQASLKRAEEQYRIGQITVDEVAVLQAQASANEANIQATYKELSILKSGRALSKSEQAHFWIQKRLTELNAEMQAQQEALKAIEERYRAGTVSSAEVSEQEQKIADIQVQIDEVKAQQLLEDQAALPTDRK